MKCVAAMVAVGLMGQCLCSAAQAQISRREANQLAVDVVSLKIGGDVRGLIIDRDDAAIQLAVRREWLKLHQPRLLESLAAEAPETKRHRQLVDRIDSWLADLGADRKEPNSLQPATTADERSQRDQHAELLRVIEAERATYQEYIDDPLKLPPGEGAPEQRRAAYGELVKRLDVWKAELTGASTRSAKSEKQQSENREELIRILKAEREAYQQQRENLAEGKADDSDFVCVTLSRADVGVVFAQSEARRQLAFAAYQNDVHQIEEQTTTQIRDELDRQGIAWQEAFSDPSAFIGGGSLQDEREWAGRRAIYEYQFLKRLDFQGTGNFIAQTGEGAPPPNLAELLQGTLDQQMSLALGDLLEEPIFTGLDFGGLGGAKQTDGWLTKATRSADRQKVRGFRVTRVTPDIQRRQSMVEDRFLAKMPDGTWETIWHVSKTQSARDANSSDLDRIKEDPQVKEVLGLVEGLGLGGGNLDLALQFGAATMNAQQLSDDEFYEFRDRYSKRLDGPPLSWK